MSFFRPSCCGKRVRDLFLAASVQYGDRIFTGANGMTLLKKIRELAQFFPKTPPKTTPLCPSIVRGRFPKRADKRSSRTEPRKTKSFFQTMCHSVAHLKNQVFSILSATFGSKSRKPAIQQTRMKPHFSISECAISWHVPHAAMDVRLQPRRTMECRMHTETKNFPKHPHKRPSPWLNK